MVSTLLLQGAVNTELDRILAGLPVGNEAEHGGYWFYETHCGPMRVVLSRTGVGMLNAALATCAGLSAYRPDAVLNQGSAGGHNGMKNIIAHLGTEEFPRLRIGVGMKPPKMDLADYVLSHFSEDEQALMNQGYDKACEALKLLLLDDISQAMNQYNGK